MRGAGGPSHAGVAPVEGGVGAEQRVQRRREGLPKLKYPDELPVSRRRDDIAAAIADHQVVIVAGETGSGKTTFAKLLCRLADPTGGLAATDPVRGQITLSRETTEPIRADLLALFEKEELVKYLAEEELYD